MSRFLIPELFRASVGSFLSSKVRGMQTIRKVMGGGVRKIQKRIYARSSH